MSNRHDMTRGSEWRLVIRFALPLMIGNILQQFYGMVDGLVVGNFVGDAALAAVGSCGTLSYVFLAASIGLGGGAGIMISQYFGARQERDMRQGASTALILLLSIGAVLAILGALFARQLCGGLMNIQDPELLEMATTYFAIYAVGFIFMFCYNTVSSILRAVGDSKASLLFLVISTVLNIALDLLFVVAFHWDVAGVAFATVLAEVVCAIVSMIYMFRKYPIFRFKRGELSFSSEKVAICLKLGIPATLQQLVVSMGSVFMQRLVNSFGQVTMSAYTVGIKIDNYIFAPAIAFNIGMATFTGQNIGAGKIDRVKRAWRQVGLIAVGVIVACSVLIYFLAPFLSGLFGISGESHARAIEYIQFMSLFFVLFAVYMVCVGVLQGAGDSIYVSICSLSSLVVRVGLAYILVYGFSWGYAAAWQTVPFGWCCSSLLAVTRYLRGSWTTKAIVKANPEVSK